MSNNQLAGFPAYGARVDTNVVYAPDETILETPLDIPTSEPGTAQVQITIATGHLPTFSPHPIPFNSANADYTNYKVLLVVMCQNLSGATRTLYAKSKTANTPTWSSATSQSVTNNYYACFSSPGISNWSVGDTEEIKIYASDTGCKLLGYGLVIAPSYVGATTLKSMYDFQLDSKSSARFAGFGAASANDTLNYMDILFATTSTTYALNNGDKTTSMMAHQADATYGILQTKIVANRWRASASASYHGITYPTRIAYTPIL